LASRRFVTPHETCVVPPTMLSVPSFWTTFVRFSNGDVTETSGWARSVLDLLRVVVVRIEDAENTGPSPSSSR
jgi:hypothetical protein